MAEVQLAHSPELLKRLVDVPYSETFAGIVGHPALAFALQLDLWREVLVIFLWTAYEKKEKRLNLLGGREIVPQPSIFLESLFHCVDVIHPQLEGLE